MCLPRRGMVDLVCTESGVRLQLGQQLRELRHLDHRTATAAERLGLNDRPRREAGVGGGVPLRRARFELAHPCSQHRLPVLQRLVRVGRRRGVHASARELVHASVEQRRSLGRQAPGRAAHFVQRKEQLWRRAAQRRPCRQRGGRCRRAGGVSWRLRHGGKGRDRCRRVLLLRGVRHGGSSDGPLGVLAPLELEAAVDLTAARRAGALERRSLRLLADGRGLGAGETASRARASSARRRVCARAEGADRRARLPLGAAGGQIKLHD